MTVAIAHPNIALAKYWGNAIAVATCRRCRACR